LTKYDKELKKNEQLYILAKEAFNEELSRIHRLDDKAMKYLTMVPILFVGYAFVCKYLIQTLIPIKGPWDMFFLFSSILTLLLFITSLKGLIQAIRIFDFQKIPVNPNIFKKYNLSTIYWGLARDIKKNMLINRKIGDNKAGFIWWVDYQLISIMVLIGLLALTSIIKNGG